MNLSSAGDSNIIKVRRLDGEIETIRNQEGHIFVCKGCCCGNRERGFPAVPLEEWKRQWKARGIRRRVHLTVSGCLGPCPMANVVLIIFMGESIWLQAINTAKDVTTVYDYVETLMAVGHYLPLPSGLAARHFSRYKFDSAATD